MFSLILMNGWSHICDLESAFVSVDGASFAHCKVSPQVSQVSVLGPLLLFIFAVDVHNAINSCEWFAM